MIERYEFNNGNVATFNTESILIEFNNKPIYKLKGLGKSVEFRNKKNELDGVVIKTKDHWNRSHYIVITEDGCHTRKCIGKCLELIPTLEKDKKERTRKIEEVKI